MDNQPPRSRPVGSPKSPPPSHDSEETDLNVDPSRTPIPRDGADQDGDFQSMGSTRIIQGAESAFSDKTHKPDDTDIQKNGPVADSEQFVLQDFKDLKKLGEGAMGAVYRAYQVSFDRVVALKILFPHVANNPKLVERLRREGTAMFELDHPNIISSYAVDVEDGRHFVAMEYINGDSLQKWVNRLGRLTVPDAIAVTLACARALEYAHAKGVIHRDIKPDNVLIDRTGVVKVADLGMVKTLDEDMALTQTGHAVGTPWYMPLEQAKNAKDTDGRCDIYALGCLFYCLLTGNPPFTGRTLVEVIQAKEIGTFAPARSVNPDVPERLDLVLVKMTAKLPRYRYQNCAEVIKDLESLKLASEKLSFLDAKPGKPVTTLKASKTPPASADIATDVWHVRFSQGRETSVRKLTTKQVKKMLEEGTIDPTAKGSRQAKEGFRALATFKEFQGTAMVKQAKKSADKQTVKYRSIYKKIEEQERQRDQDEKKDERHTSYYSSLLKPALLIGAAVAGAAFVVFLLNKLLGIF